MVAERKRRGEQAVRLGPSSNKMSGHFLVARLMQTEPFNGVFPVKTCCVINRSPSFVHHHLLCPVLSLVKATQEGCATHPTPFWSSSTMFRRSPSNCPHPLPHLVTSLEHSPSIPYLPSKLGVGKHFHDSGSRLNVTIGELSRDERCQPGRSGSST